MPLIIAGERSGVGKTTITLALLSYLTRKGYKVQSFKVGPDYIDPMFHTAITGYPCRNLDPILTSESYVQRCFNLHSQDKDISIIEGVMGLFDGVNCQDDLTNLRPDYASTAHIARLLNIPVALVIDCRHISSSVAAIAQGYRSLDPRMLLVGVILNRVASDRHLELLTNALNSIKMPILGVFYRQDSITIPDRHLGLVPTDELSQLSTLWDQLAYLAENAFNWDLISPYLFTPSFPYSHTPSSPQFPKVKIAIARDRAFNFYYADNLDILEELGAELCFFSPLTSEKLPQDTYGLILGGGFPEIFAQQLSQNTSMIESIYDKIMQGMPTYAECGGLMYLSEGISNFDNEYYLMTGILPTKARMTSKLTLGYRKAVNIKPTYLLKPPDSLWGHEFHRSQLTESPINPIFQLVSRSAKVGQTLEGWGKNRLHASYLHFHWGEKKAIAQNFLQTCLDFSQKLR